MRISRTATAMMLTLLAARGAWADSDSLVTLGFGTAFGVVRSDTKASGMSSDLRARLRLVRALGAEIAYNATDLQGPANATVQDSRLRLSALLYLVPTFPVGGYVKAGVGAPSFEQARRWVGDDVTYHGGGGLEVALGDHLVLGAEVLWLVPPVSDVVPGLGESDDTAEEPDRPAFSLDNIGRNYRAVLSLSYYL